MTRLARIAIRACAFPLIITAVAGTAPPSQLCAQHAPWFTQLEGHVGWWFPVGYETQAIDASGNQTTVELRASLAFQRLEWS